MCVRVYVRFPHVGIAGAVYVAVLHFGRGRHSPSSWMMLCLYGATNIMITVRRRRESFEHWISFHQYGGKKTYFVAVFIFIVASSGYQNTLDMSCCVLIRNGHRLVLLPKS